MDRLAKSGVLFENAFSNSPWTLPAHASLFTGRLPSEHKADWSQPLGDKYPTLAEVLYRRGYLTAAFSANTSYVAPEWGLGRGFTHFAAHGNSVLEDATSTVYGKKLALNILPRVGYFDIPGRKNAQQVNEELFDWIDRSHGKPFFAFLNYFDIHDPYLTDRQYQTRFGGTVTRGELINFQFQANAFRRKPTLTPQEIQAEVDSYDGCLSYLDAKLGELFAELSRRGLEKNTLLVITSDHGEAFGSHDLFGHGNGLYIDSLHVPLIIVWPSKVPSDKRVTQLAGLQNVAATILELLGETNSGIPGESLARLWSAQSDSASQEAILSDLTPGRFSEGPSSYPTTKGDLQSLVSDQWHLIVSKSGHTELYAWREDRAETKNLAETPEGRKVVEELKQRLAAARSQAE